MNGLARPVAMMLVRKWLSSLRDYPAEAGEGRLADTLAECTLGVQHAEAVLEYFDHSCPTPREIRETAYNLKSRFQPEPDLRAKWEAESGPPAPFEPAFQSGDPIKHRLAELAAENREIWRRVKERLGKNDMTHVGWGTIYAAMRELGYPLTSEQARMIGGAVLPPRPETQEPRRITQADIDAAKKKQQQANGGENA